MAAAKIKKGDKVVILSGKDKGRDAGAWQRWVDDGAK